MIEPFKNPGLAQPTPLRIEGDTVYGHVASWQTSHIGRAGINPPRNTSDYRYFHLGAYDLDGRDIDVGSITMHTCHSDVRLPAQEAQRAYEDTGSVGAYIRVGEDAHGIWMSGRVAKGLDEADREALRGAKVSGDWRNIQGRLELIGVLAVVIPGFPIERERAILAAGQDAPMTLLASGIVFEQDEADPRVALRLRSARHKLAARLK